MITMRDAAAAAKAFKHAIQGEVVSPDEIRRRGAICNTCPKRQLVRNRSSQVSQKLGLLANRHRVSPEVKDYACGVCGCALLLLLPATPGDLHVDSEKEASERPEKCWLTSVQKPA
jgi:hypothetical protein